MEEDRPISCKVVMIGNSGVGKTSLVNTWVNGSYTSKTTPTIGANHLRKIVKIDDDTLDVCVWDTAGQEQYHSLTPLYTRAAAAAIAVASISDVDSFESLKMWLQLVADSCEDVPPVILAVSKTDLATSETPSYDDIEAKYGEFFEGIFFTSALSGENVNSLFMQSAKLGLRFLREKGKVAGLNLQTENAVATTERKKKCC